MGLNSSRNRAVQKFLRIGATGNRPLLEPQAAIYCDREKWSRTDQWVLNVEFDDISCQYKCYFGSGGKYRLAPDMSYTPSDDRCALVLEYVGDRMILYAHSPAEIKVRELMLVDEFTD